MQDWQIGYQGMAVELMQKELYAFPGVIFGEARPSEKSLAKELNSEFTQAVLSKLEASQVTSDEAVCLAKLQVLQSWIEQERNLTGLEIL